MSDDDDAAAVEDLLAFLRDSRSLDFTGYKRPSLTRRIRKRMDAVGVSTFDQYRDLLEANPGEAIELVDTILINVTSFFRDPDAWDHLREEVVPAIVEAKPQRAPIRIWSAGCATGEEAYTLAMVFADHLGIEAFKARVKIYATDTDEAALAVGRSGRYTAEQLEAVPADLRERFFEPVGTQSLFRPDCRRSVIFGRHDITSDAPISRLDLLVCRNVLMYLVRETQHRVLSRFHYALGDAGYLFLGRAETIFAHADLFTTTAPRFRVFQRAQEPVGRDQILALTAPDTRPHVDHGVLRQLALEARPVAQLVIDIDGVLVEANTNARAMFGLSNADVGRPFRDIEGSLRPIDLRSNIEQAYVEAHPVVLRGIDRTLADGQAQFLEVTIAPLVDPSGVALGVSVSFVDVTELGRTKAELERSARDLRLANEDLHSANEALETSNEELQSTNEELETTNEELQSANEELETMNEELQSANEEFETMNEELVDQAAQIERSGRFLSALLDSLAVGVVVVDEDLDVLVWNRAMEQRFGLQSDEAIGRSLLALDIGMPVADLGPALHSVARDETGEPTEVMLDAVTRSGRPFRSRVTIDLLADGHSGADADHPQYVVLVDELPSGSP